MTSARGGTDSIDGCSETGFVILTFGTLTEYYTEIESHFALRRGTPFVLSAKDWHLMKRWHDDGIPLPIIIEAIDTVFEKNETSGRKKTISSLSYCRHAVKELWDERKELAVGDDATTPEASPAVALEALATELEASDVARFFAPRIRELERMKSVPKIESRLMELGADEFLSKSAGMRALIAKVFELLGLESGNKIIKKF